MLAAASFDLCDNLGKFIVKVCTSETEAQIYKAVVHYLPLLLPLKRASVALITSDGRNFEVIALEGLETDFQIGAQLPYDQNSHIKQCILNQKPNIAIAYDDSPFLDLSHLAKAGLVTVMCAPLKLSNHIIGTLNIASEQKDVYGMTELSLFTQITVIIATNLERLRLIQQTQASMERHRTHAERLQILNEMGRLLSSATIEDQVFPIIAEATEKILSADRVSYVIPNPDGLTCQIFALTGNDAIPRAHNFPLEGSGVAVVLDTGQPMAFPDLSESDYGEHAMLLAQGLCSGWSVPVQVEKKIVGILNAATSFSLPFPNEGLTLLDALGRFMGTTIERIQAQQHVHLTLQKLEYQVSHDMLTGLYNRTEFEKVLARAITHYDAIHVQSEAIRTSQMLPLEGSLSEVHLAILFIDLDGFKGVNDSLSHSIGDQLLYEIAQRLEAVVLPRDIVARMGGDEFVVLLTDVTNPEIALFRAQQLLNALRDNFFIGKHCIQISGSIGMSFFPEHGHAPEVLIKHADIAMYAAKAQGRNNCQIYSKRMSEELNFRLNLERALSQAIPNNELYIMFQPQFEVSSGKVVALEALLRWCHPTQGLISPAIFIPIAEDSGLIGDISDWVLDQSLRALALLREQHPDLSVSVNISAKNLRRPDRLTMQIQKTLQKYNLPGDSLELELTESVFLEQAETAIDVIQILKQQGIRLAIDDFGTGFSSLSYLLNLPMDTLKIDRTFIQDIHTDSRKKGIVETILALGNSLNVTSVAEGVEELRQLECLSQLGCLNIQGFLLAKPMRFNELTHFLEDYGSVTRLPEFSF